MSTAHLQQGVTYNVDLVMCIDTTGSMQPVLDAVIKSALSFYDDLQAALKSKSKIVDQLRVKVIEFRDFYVDAATALRESGFLRLPDQRAEFDAFVRSLKADGGGDEPESGLEAVACAMSSDWTKTGDKRRHVILVYTDASAHPLDSDKPKPASYPAGLPHNLDEATDFWSSLMNENAKRMILFAPDVEPWNVISAAWEQVVHFPSQAGMGLAEMEYEMILNSIAQSV